MQHAGSRLINGLSAVSALGTDLIPISPLVKERVRRLRGDAPDAVGYCLSLAGRDLYRVA